MVSPTAEEKSPEGTDPESPGQCWFVTAHCLVVCPQTTPMLSSDQSHLLAPLHGKSWTWAWVSLEIEPWQVQEHMQSGEEGTGVER